MASLISSAPVKGGVCVLSTVTTPEIYALGTVTTGVSLLVIGLAFGTFLLIQRRRARRVTLPGT